MVVVFRAADQLELHRRIGGRVLDGAAEPAVGGNAERAALGGERDGQRGVVLRSSSGPCTRAARRRATRRRAARTRSAGSARPRASSRQLRRKRVTRRTRCASKGDVAACKNLQTDGRDERSFRVDRAVSSRLLPRAQSGNGVAVRGRARPAGAAHLCGAERDRAARARAHRVRRGDRADRRGRDGGSAATDRSLGRRGRASCIRRLSTDSAPSSALGGDARRFLGPASVGIPHVERARRRPDARALRDRGAVQRPCTPRARG